MQLKLVMSIRGFLSKSRSIREVAQAHAISEATARRYLNALCAERMAYVERWADDARGCPIVRMYRQGDQESAPRHTPANSAQRMAKTRAARRATLLPTKE